MQNFKISHTFPCIPCEQKYFLTALSFQSHLESKSNFNLHCTTQISNKINVLYAPQDWCHSKIAHTVVSLHTKVMFIHEKVKNNEPRRSIKPMLDKELRDLYTNHYPPNSEKEQYKTIIITVPNEFLALSNAHRCLGPCTLCLQD